MNGRLIDNLKNIFYAKFQKVGTNVSFLWSNGKTYYSKHNASEYCVPDQYGDYHGYTTSYTCYYFAPRTATLQSAADIHTAMTRTIQEQSFLDRSDDTQKETLLHHFLRHYDIFPDPESQSGRVQYRKWTDLRESQEEAITVEAFRSRRDAQFPQFVADVRAENQKIDQDVFTPMLQTLTPDELYQALSAKDIDGNTPLQVNIQGGPLRRLQLVSQYIKDRLSVDQKRNLLNSCNKKGETLLQSFAGDMHQSAFDMLYNAFGSLIEEEIATSSTDFFHRLCSNTPATINSVLNSLTSAPAMDMKKEGAEKEVKLSSNVPQQLLVRDGENRNFLHLICRKARFDQKALSKTIEITCTILNAPYIPSFSYKDTAIMQVTAKGLNPLHYACRSGNIDNVKYLVADLKPSVLYQAVSTQNKGGYTPLHYVCEFGSRDMLKTIFAKLDTVCPGASYYLLKKHEASLQKCVKKNKNGFQEIEFQHIVNQYTSNLYPEQRALSHLVNMYRYLEQRSKEGETDRDYIARKEDFLNQLEFYVRMFQGREDTHVFTGFERRDRFMGRSTCCFFGGSQRYYNCLNQLQDCGNNMSLDVFKQFEGFLAQQGASSLAVDIKTQLRQLPEAVNNNEQEIGPVASVASAPSLNLNS